MSVSASPSMHHTGTPLPSGLGATAAHTPRPGTKPMYCSSNRPAATEQLSFAWVREGGDPWPAFQDRIRGLTFSNPDDDVISRLASPCVRSRVPAIFRHFVPRPMRMHGIYCITVLYSTFTASCCMLHAVMQKKAQAHARTALLFA